MESIDKFPHLVSHPAMQEAEAAVHLIPLTSTSNSVEATPIDDDSLIFRAGLQILQVLLPPQMILVLTLL